MFLLLMACLVAQPAPLAAAPPTAVTLQVVEAVGATARQLALVCEASVAAEECDAARAALLETGLFELGDAGQAPVQVMLRRLDPATVLVTVAARDGERLKIAPVTWPQPAATPTVARDEEAVRSLALRYWRERLRIVPYAQTASVTPVLVAGWGARGYHYPAAMNFDFASNVPVPTTAHDWLIVRGIAEIVDEDAFAELLGNPTLGRRIEAARFWPRVFWVSGFGALAAGGIGTGVWLHGRRDRDLRAVGVSLITVGVVSAVLALLFPTVGPRHVLSAGEAERLADDYNERLRRELSLSAEDLRAHAPAP